MHVSGKMQLLFDMTGFHGWHEIDAGRMDSPEARRSVGRSMAKINISQVNIAPCGRIAKVGVHGKPVELYIEKRWRSNITRAMYPHRCRYSTNTAQDGRVGISGCKNS